MKNRLGLGEKDEEMMTSKISIIEGFGVIGDALKGATTLGTLQPSSCISEIVV